MIALDKAFGFTLSKGPSYEAPAYQIPHPSTPQPAQQRQVSSTTVDHLGQMLGISGNVSGSQEFCNMILFIAFGIFSLFVLDSLVKLAIRRAKFQ